MTTAAAFTTPYGGVLVASASSTVRADLLRSFGGYGGRVQSASGGADALAQLEGGDWQVLFLDPRLPDLDAEELSQTVRGKFPAIEVVMLSADGACRWNTPRGSGWESWLKPAPEPSSPGIARPLSSEHEEAVAPLPGMVGDSPVMRRLYKLTRLVARHSTTVLIVGETGTGKELVARAVHQLSRRAAHPFIVVNCAAIPEPLLESELFGYARGSFTGAVQAYPGRIYSAQGGTLFLDEVGELPLGLQAKLLRFLDRKEIQRLGSPDPVRVDVRIVAATNALLDRMVDHGRFRADLFYRLSAFPLDLPRLADRPGDIVPLARRFLDASNSAGPAVALTDEAAHILERQPWNGNVRELQQVMERASILADGEVCIGPEHLHFRSACSATAIIPPSPSTFPLS